jgi:hypothetical protein
MSTARQLSWTLIDDTSTDLPAEVTYTAGETAPDKWSIQLRTLHGGKREGVQVVEVHNGVMTLVIIPTRGMSLWKAYAKGDNGEPLELGWRSPVRGPVHPSFVPVHAPNGIGWLDGFDELLVRCGLENNGPPVIDEQGILQLPLHGRIGNLPAHHVTATVDLDAQTINITGIVDETRFHFQKLRLTACVTIPFGQTSFIINDVISNLSTLPAESQLLYHLNVGEPLLDAGSTIEVNASQVLHQKLGINIPEDWATVPAPQADRPEDVYYISNNADENGYASIRFLNSKKSQGVRVTYRVDSLPCFSYWKNTPSSFDGYVVGLEPATGYPNPRWVEAEAGRILKIPPGRAYSTEIMVDWLTKGSE